MKRPQTDQSWGFLVPSGLLVGVDVALREVSALGNRVNDVPQQTSCEDVLQGLQLPNRPPVVAVAERTNGQTSHATVLSYSSCASVACTLVFRPKLTFGSSCWSRHGAVRGQRSWKPSGRRFPADLVRRHS